MLARRAANIDARAREYEEQFDAYIEKLEKAGDFREARLQRMEKMRIRERLEAEDPV
jgi:hypothetical protein